MNKLYSAVKHNLITFSKTPASLILVILPLMMLFVFGTIYPVSNILPHVITVSVITVSFSFVGIQFIEYRQNKFFRTNKSLSISNSTFILGTFITLMIILMIASLTLTTITWFFSQPVPILQQTVDNIYYDEIDPIKQYLNGEEFFSAFKVEYINWLKFMYAMLVSIVMTSLFAILVGSMFKSVKSFTVLTLTYLILYVVLGGLALPYNVIHQSTALTFLSDLLPNTHTNNLLTSSMNEGNVKAAYNYINYSDAVCKWIVDINDRAANGEFYVILDIPTLFSDMASLGGPIVEEDWMDPIASDVVMSYFPWMFGLFQTVGDLLFNIPLEINAKSLMLISYVAAFTNDGGAHAVATFTQTNALIYSVYHTIGQSLSLMIHPDPFDFQTKYGIMNNVYPFIIILLTLPNFILIGREE